MNPASPNTYKVIKQILAVKSFTQLELEGKTGVSHGQVNHVVNWLKDHKYVEWREGKYCLVDPAGVLSLFTLVRRMDKHKSLSLLVAIDPMKIQTYFPKEAVFCLESALEQYSEYFRGGRVCAYYDDPEEIMTIFRSYTGNLTEISIYESDISLENDMYIRKGMKFTDRIRTVIDLACDGKMYVARDLLRELWGLRVD